MDWREEGRRKLECPNLIDELTFSRAYSWFWRAAIPMSEAYVRRINLGLYERAFRPLPGSSAPGKRAFINELGFCAFRDRAGGAWRGPEWVRPSRFALATEIEEVWGRIGRLKDQTDQLPIQTDTDDIREALQLASRLQAFFRDYSHLSLEPVFPGCGIVEECRGDVIADETLLEIKAGDRPFRSMDVRQVLTYLALNHAAADLWSIQMVSLLNPRVGIVFSQTVDELCFGVSGIDRSQLLDTIVYEMSRADVSR